MAPHTVLRPVRKTRENKAVFKQQKAEGGPQIEAMSETWEEVSSIEEPINQNMRLAMAISHHCVYEDT